MKKIKFIAVVLAGGQGIRMGSSLPKQFRTVLGKPLFIHTLNIYEKITEVDEVCLVISAEHRLLYNKFLKRYPCPKVKYIVEGGQLRQESIRNAVLSLPLDVFLVLHNGVCANISPDLVRKTVRVAPKTGVATPYELAYHTVFSVKKNGSCKVYKRKNLGYACHPFVVRADILRKAMGEIRPNMKRQMAELEMIQKIKQDVVLIKTDSHQNVKLTYEHDLKTIEFILKRYRSDQDKSQD